MKKLVTFSLLLFTLAACDKNTTPSPATPNTSYFPPIGSTTWETQTAASLGWNETALQPLKDFLTQKNTKSFMILVNGRIVLEWYLNGHNSSSAWEWNSAGKTLVATTTGLAQQDGFVNINNKASSYLGTGWTSMPLAKENLISIKHLLTMSSGINDSNQLVIRPNLSYMADAGARWAYGNVFQKLIDVVAQGSGQNFETYFNNRLKNTIGMDGYWNFGTVFSIYHSTARSMARFGLLAINNGQWNGQQVVNAAFFNESTSTSQNINPSYGYLWWLNGKNKYMIPNAQTVFSGSLVSNAPTDMYAAMGANDQRLFVIPSKKMVVVRMGNASDPANPSFAVSGFDNALWEKINTVIN
jgi:CubicO group peptidase (beta-lactamase class C family)